MNDIVFDRISLDEGLSQSIVYSICQDSTGFIWFATQEGLNKFDGYKFRVYKNNKVDPNSLAINYVSALFEDRDGVLWVGGMNDNLSRYDMLNDNFVNLNLDNDPEIMSSTVITSIVQDSDGIFWIGTCDGGLKRYNKHTHTIEHLIKKNGSGLFFDKQDISCLLSDSSGNVWIGTMTEGLYCYEKKSDRILKYSEMFSIKENLSNNNITALFEDHNRNLWIGTTNGVNFLDMTNVFLKKYFCKPEYIINCRVSSITQDAKKNLWIGTKNWGLIRFTDDNCYNVYKHDPNHLNSLSGNSIYSLYIDRTNVLWIGTVTAGINKIDCGKKLFYNITKLSSGDSTFKMENVRTIYKDSLNQLWIGTSKNGVYVIGKERDEEITYMKQIRHLHELVNKNISRIFEDSNNIIWLTSFSEGSLVKYNTIENKLDYFTFDEHDAIHSLVAYGNSYLLGSSSSGMINFNIEKEKFEEFKPELDILDKFSKDKMFCMMNDDDDNLWVGTQNEGLYRINLKDKCTTNFRNDENDSCGLNDNFITSLHIDRHQNLWVGTFSGGLNKLEKNNQRFINYDSRFGIKDNVKGILEDDNNMLWLSTYYGLLRFNTLDMTVQEYHFSDGLQSNEFNDGAYYKDKDGTMYFGGINGITYFKPEEITENPYIPEIAITDFQIFNSTVTGSSDNSFLKQNITYANEINLTYRESVFSFEFAALIFNNPQKNQYAYKMEGFDKDWTYCGTRRHVTYTNLNPGEYIFRVKASNNDAIWNEEGESIKINISPPYWKTWWFKSLGFLSVAAFTGYSYRQRLEKLEKESKAQEEFSRKLIESQESERKRIAHELHDTIAHEVLISKQKAMMALKHKDDKERMTRTLEEISELSSATITDMRNIAYNLHPHQLDRLGFTKTIRSIINDVSKSTNLKFDFETDNVDEVLSKESEINLYRVIQECITNIIKHSMATAAKLSVSKLEDYLLIVLTDNGKGIDVKGRDFDEAKSGLGISGIMERIKYMKGEIKVESEINKGTTLRFKIPIKK